MAIQDRSMNSDNHPRMHAPATVEEAEDEAEGEAAVVEEACG
jgi:hypothetical protein